jgi:hypothetical protein
VECALNGLRMPIRAGYATPKRVAEELNFAALRGLPAFEQRMGLEKPVQRR